MICSRSAFELLYLHGTLVSLSVTVKNLFNTYIIIDICRRDSVRVTEAPATAPPRAAQPSTDLLVLSRRVQVQLSIGPDALGHQPLCISQPLAEVVHVAVELPPLLHGTVKTPAAKQEAGGNLSLASVNRRKNFSKQNQFRGS